MSSTDTAALAADAPSLLVGGAALLGWHRFAFLVHLAATAVLWAGTLLH